MTSPLVWFRLYRGKVWHLRLASAMQALCETPDLPSDRADACERVYGPVPENARLCEACGAASDVIADAIRLARQGDPRRLLPGVVGDLAPVDVGEPVDLAAVLAESFARARQRRIDNTPCPDCGGDRLRSDFTGSGRCHAPMGDAS